jgi:hypothetical protein
MACGLKVKYCDSIRKDTILILAGILERELQNAQGERVCDLSRSLLDHEAEGPITTIQHEMFVHA